MLFNRHKVVIGKQYGDNDEKDVQYETLFLDRVKNVLMVKDIKDNIVSFILGNCKVKHNNLAYDNIMTFSLTDTELVNCINECMVRLNKATIGKGDIIRGIRDKYYKIPSHLAEVIAEWYLQNKDRK